MTGKIISIVANKGFFFLRSGKTDYFAHKDDLPKGTRIEHLEVGEEWTFDIAQSERGPRAGNLSKPERTLDSLLEQDSAK